ncbi:MAG: GGDEF domain-containing protein, partial [Pseudomonas sp.]
MNNDARRWKDKYLASLEQQEVLERRWDARVDLLRRGLVRSTLAAEGADKAVDQCMQDLREILRRDDMDAGLSALIPRLEKAVLDSEQRRQQRVGQVSTALVALVDQLLELDLPREVRKPLKSYAKQLDSRAEQVRELPLLLAELSALQQQALAVLGHEQAERPGLLQRLFAGRAAAIHELPAAPESVPVPVAPLPVPQPLQPALVALTVASLPEQAPVHPVVEATAVAVSQVAP